MRVLGMFDPAMTDFRARGTIMGPAGLTAVFGMGTGVAPPVWSPEGGRGADGAPPVAWTVRRPAASTLEARSWRLRFPTGVGPSGRDRHGFGAGSAPARSVAPSSPLGRAAARRRVGVVKLLGC